MPVKSGNWNSDRAKVLWAIAVDGARTLEEIRESTGINEIKLNQAIAKLVNQNLITVTKDNHRIVDYNLYREYKDYSDGKLMSEYLKTKQESKKDISEFRERLQNIRKYLDEKELMNKVSIINVILGWTVGNGVYFDIDKEHFFVEGGLLHRVSEYVIAESKERLVVVNPFIEKCPLSDMLIEGSNSKEVTLLTRTPDNPRKRKYHNSLMKAGVKVYYNKYVHSKIIGVDERLAIVSSMNFTPTPSRENPWETGVVTWEKNNVEKIFDSINTNLNSINTEKYLK
jgi:hypothetical protein